jgi:3-oxoadipate enol-lactonase
MPDSAEAADGALFVADSGEADLPVVLCLHSLFMDGRMFDAFVQEAAGRYRVIRPDFRGQGRSPRPSSAIVTMDDCADDIVALLDAADLGAVHVLAQSMGGDVIFRVAARRPDLVRSMAILGSSARAEPPDQLEDFRGVVDEFRAQGFTGDLLELLMQVMFGETTRQDAKAEPMLSHWRRTFGELPSSLAPAMLGVVERESVVGLLAGITAPTLVISGAEDMPRPPDWSDEVVEHLVDSELVRLDGVGHSVILEAPDVVIPRVLEFFDTEAARGDEAA